MLPPIENRDPGDETEEEDDDGLVSQDRNPLARIPVAQISEGGGFAAAAARRSIIRA